MLAVYYLVSPGVLASQNVEWCERGTEKSGNRAAALQVDSLEHWAQHAAPLQVISIELQELQELVVGAG